MTTIRSLGDGRHQVTLDASRWYFDEEGKPYPSVTWVLEYFPKGKWFYVWLADRMQSYDEVKDLMKRRGVEGSNAHWLMERYLSNDRINRSDINPETGQDITDREWEMFEAGVRWCDVYEPIVQAVEYPVFGDNYAGTVDLICMIDGEKFAERRPGGKFELPFGEGQIPFMIDWKTSTSIYESHKAQVGAYAVAQVGESLSADAIGIVQLGSRHKIGFNFWYENYAGVQEYYELFKSAYRFWLHDNPNPAPKFKEIRTEYQYQRGTTDGEQSPEVQRESGETEEPDPDNVLPQRDSNSTGN